MEELEAGLDHIEAIVTEEGPQEALDEGLEHGEDQLRGQRRVAQGHEGCQELVHPLLVPASHKVTWCPPARQQCNLGEDHLAPAIGRKQERGLSHFIPVLRQ